MTSAIMRTAHDLFLQGFCAFAPGGVVLANAFMRGRGHGFARASLARGRWRNPRLKQLRAIGGIIALRLFPDA
jgi:hypothetical protein